MSAFDAHLDNYGDPGADWYNSPTEDYPDRDFDAELYDSAAEQDYWEEVQEFEHRDDEPDWQPDEDEEAEAAAFEEQRAFERWADEQILEDENADVSAQAYADWWVAKYEPLD